MAWGWAIEDVRDAENAPIQEMNRVHQQIEKELVMTKEIQGKYV